MAEDARRVFELTASHVGGLILDVTVDDLLDAYERDHVEANGVGPTQHWSLLQIRRGLGGRVISDLTPGVLGAYRRTRECVVASPTVRRELGALRAAVTWGAKRGVIPADTVIHVDLPPGGKPRDKFLSDTEEQKLWDAASALATGPEPFDRRRVGVFVCLALETAARQEAILTLTWSQVKHGLIDFHDPARAATKKRRAKVPVSARLRPVLDDVLVREGTGTGAGYVLGHPGSIRGSFRRLLDRLGPEFEGLRVHDLRRTWASLRVSWGVPIGEVAAVLGDTVATTEKHYAHFAPDYLRGAVNARRPLSSDK